MKKTFQGKIFYLGKFLLDFLENFAHDNKIKFLIVHICLKALQCYSTPVLFLCVFFFCINFRAKLFFFFLYQVIFLFKVRTMPTNVTEEQCGGKLEAMILLRRDFLICVHYHYINKIWWRIYLISFARQKQGTKFSFIPSKLFRNFVALISIFSGGVNRTFHE